MADAVVSKLGAANGTGDERANFVKVATGEVLTAFTRKVEFMDKHMVRSIEHGKSASFAVTGRTSGARSHVPGTEILGTEAKFNERVITIDDLVISDYFTADIWEKMNHFDTRAEMTKQLGEELAQAFDRNVAQMLVLASRGVAVVDGLPGGSSLTAATMKTDAAVLAKAHFDAAQRFDEIYVPENDRYSILKPAQYYMLVQNKDVINKDWDGRGSYAEGSIHKIADIPIYKSNNIPTTNIVTGNTKYQGNFSTTAGLIFQKGLGGTVKLMDLSVEVTDMPWRKGTLIVAGQAVGHGPLRPECGIELKTA